VLLVREKLVPFGVGGIQELLIVVACVGSVQGHLFDGSKGKGAGRRTDVRGVANVVFGGCLDRRTACI